MAIKIRFKTPSKHRKNWCERHEYIDHQSASITEAIALVKELYPEAYDLEAKTHDSEFHAQGS